MKKRGNPISKYLLGTLIALSSIALLVLVAYPSWPQGALVAQPLSYSGPQQIIMGQELLVDMAPYFSTPIQTLLATESPGLEVELRGSVLRLKTNETFAQFPLTVIAADAEETLTVPLNLIVDSSKEATLLAYPLDQVQIEFTDGHGLALEGAELDTEKRTLAFSHQPYEEQGSRLDISGVTLYSSLFAARVGEMQGAATHTFVLDDVSGTFTYILAANESVNRIARCDSFDAISFSCASWLPMDIQFKRNETHLWFSTTAQGVFAGIAGDNKKQSRSQESSTPQNAKISPDLERQFRSNLKAKVIVILKDPSPSPSGSFSASAVRREGLAPRKERIAQKANGVLGRLNPVRARGMNAQARDNFELKHISTTVPIMSGTVSRSGLDALAQDPDVERIVPDRILELTSDATVAIVDGDFVRNITLNGTKLNGTGVSVCVIDSGIDQTTQTLAQESSIARVFARPQTTATAAVVCPQIRARLTTRRMIMAMAPSLQA